MQYSLHESGSFIIKKGARQYAAVQAVPYYFSESYILYQLIAYDCVGCIDYTKLVCAVSGEGVEERDADV